MYLVILFFHCNSMIGSRSIELKDVSLLESELKNLVETNLLFYSGLGMKTNDLYYRYTTIDKSETKLKMSKA